MQHGGVAGVRERPEDPAFVGRGVREQVQGLVGVDGDHDGGVVGGLTVVGRDAYVIRTAHDRTDRRGRAHGKQFLGDLVDVDAGAPVTVFHRGEPVTDNRPWCSRNRNR